MIDGKTIVVKEKGRDMESSAGRDTITVRGIVYNDAGQPLAGANVILKETNRGVTTNARGEFTYPGISINETLIISYIGYASQEIKAKIISDLKIYLNITKNELDKVVIQAYGTTSKRLMTGNIGTVTSAEISRQPVMNPIEALQGEVPGVVITNNSGYASGAIKVEIRGRSSINSSFPSDPLYIIDGVPLTIVDLTGTSNYAQGSQGVIQSGVPSPAIGQSPFFSLNPSDIESISVLKDADATAIYGSRGANGVILITTKKGKAGKTHCDISVTSGMSEVPKYYKMLNTSQYLKMRREALNNDGLPINANTAPDLAVWDTTRYTNWQRVLWGKMANLTDAEMSIIGGDQLTTFRLGASYRNQTDILTASGSNIRGSLSFNFNHKSQDQRFSLSFSNNYSIAASNMLYTPATAATLPPDAPAVFNTKGVLNYVGWSPQSSLLSPFSALLQPYSTKTNFLNSNLVLSEILSKELVFRTSFGYGNIITSQSITDPIASQNPANNPTGSANIGQTFINNAIVEPQFEYNRLIGSGKFDWLVGASYQVNNEKGVELIGQGYTNDILLNGIGKAPLQTAINSSGGYKYDALFSRITYNYLDKYILSLNGRRDGSSKFGPGRQYGNFGSVGAAWIITDEAWVKKAIPWLSFGKIRGSYGLTGSDPIGPYQYESQWAFQQLSYNGIVPVLPTGHVDSTLHWQVNRKLEGAIDLGALKDRLTMEVAWYRDRCNDQLVSFPTPNFTGFSSVVSNSPANIQNMGWEITLNSKWIDDKKIKWETKFNIGINRNRLLSYPNLSQSPYAYSLRIGMPLTLARVLHFDGINPQNGNYIFQDRNHDGQITYNYLGLSDDTYLLNITPRYDGGMRNTVDYKNFEFSVFIYFKRQLGRSALSSIGNAPGTMVNQPIEVLSRWQKPRDNTDVAKFTTIPSNLFSYYQGNSDADWIDASFIRLQNAVISYVLPSRISNSIKLKNITVYLKGQNLLIISKFKGPDPEIQGFGSLPLPRIITGGLEVNF